MTNIDSEIAAFDKFRTDLEANHMGEWVLIHGGELVATFASFDEAARHATRSFGHGPYLIRQVGAPPVVLPASVMYNLLHA